MTEPTLSLRCTARTVPATPPLHAFASGARLVDPGDDVLAWLAPTTPIAGTSGLRRRERLAPLPLYTATPSSADFAMRLGSSLRQSLPAPSPQVLAIAAAVPLALSPALAFAQDATEVEPSEEASDDGPAKELDLSLPAPSEDLSYTGSLLWDALVGRTVELRMGDGLSVEGTVLTQTSSEVAIARSPDGDLMRVPKELVIGLRVRPDAPQESPQVIVQEAPGRDRDEWERNRPPKGGKAMATVGAILTGVGSTMMTTFALGTAFDSSFPYYGFPLMIMGPAFLGPGIPVLVGGLAREEERGAWESYQRKKKAGLDVSMGPTMDGGWSGKLSIRF